MDSTPTTDQPQAPEYTGKYLVTFAEPDEAAAREFVGQNAGMSLATMTDFEGVSAEDLEGAGPVYLPDLGIAIVDADPDQTLSLASASDDSNGRVVVEPEQIMRAIGRSPDYLTGFRDGLNLALGEGGEEEDVSAEAFVNGATTWGLQATRAGISARSGAGIRVCVLDTGIQLTHPDFAGRPVVTRSFIAGETVSPDVHGHGSHCCGTVAGPRGFRPGIPGYGCAPGVQLYMGKVLSNAGSGADSGILAGIQWAISQGCHVISMSLGAPVTAGGFSVAYEQAASLALARGCLIVAAAGNDSNRPGVIRPVSRPANSPSIMAVGALDPNLRIAPFSNRGIFPPGGAVDIAAPGVVVFSAAVPVGYRSLSGTSMATPHVAGIAALWAQASGLRGQALWNLIRARARAIGLPAADVGTGLVQAP